ncbi:LptA/OstA family protein [Pseudoblastomonas halimionae]|uniref:OstA family protein n=1 Tax=Alteriqipengyuania halimionae TaxID=1926630 RepID=A0A6I4U750_9SPHN|nr:LptA/OstA family protein [Alteriqipengyuania halimionae]MXP10693.1 OstA family protein [Alteriqipengyuania halimionae]
MTTRSRPPMRIALLAFVLMGLALFAATRLPAQAIAGHNSNAPVEFDADNFTLDDRANRAVLSGNVIIRQAGLTMRASRTIIDYSDAGALQINRITATGGVTVTRGNESARGGVAVYDFGRRIITMAGGVTLNRGSDKLSGGRLTIDLRSGVSSIGGGSSGSSDGPATSTGSNGRVSGSFRVPDSN